MYIYIYGNELCSQLWCRTKCASKCAPVPELCSDSNRLLKSHCEQRLSSLLKCTQHERRALDLSVIFVRHQLETTEVRHGHAELCSALVTLSYALRWSVKQCRLLFRFCLSVIECFYLVLRLCCKMPNLSFGVSMQENELIWQLARPHTYAISVISRALDRKNW